MFRPVKGGIYLVIDPAEDIDILLPVIQKSIDGGLDVLQIWNHWNDDQDKHQMINTICSVAHAREIPVIMNEDWTLLKSTRLDGVHFDNQPDDLDAIRMNIHRSFFCGITCGNDPERVLWADRNALDYISFCSMFPSSSVDSCELIKPETVRQARRMTRLPIFVAGGLTLENVTELSNLGMNGLAIISAIRQSDNPELTTRTFKNILNKSNYEKIID